MPDTAAPEEFFDVCERPKRGEKDDPMLRKRAIDRPRLLTPLLHIEPDQRKVRHTVDDHVRYGEGVVGVERDDPDIPANRRSCYDDILTGIQEAACPVK